MSLSRQFKTNKVKVTEGAPVDFPPNEDGSIPVFYISQMSDNNPQYQAKLAALTKPYERQIKAQTLSNSKAMEINCELVATVSLKNWENVLLSDVTGDSNDTGFAPFSVANARKLLQRLPDLCTELVTAGQNFRTFLADEMEDEAKN